jgi:hypothetical protein
MDTKKKSGKKSGSPALDNSAESANNSAGSANNSAGSVNNSAGSVSRAGPPLYRAALERSARKRAIPAPDTMQDITNVVGSVSRLNERKGQHIILTQPNECSNF